jgi:hypothetical protein
VSSTPATYVGRGSHLQIRLSDCDCQRWLHKALAEAQRHLTRNTHVICLRTKKNAEESRRILAAGGILIPNDNVMKEFDLVYSNQGGAWNDFARNWTLAKASFVNLINELDFKVIPFGKPSQNSGPIYLKSLLTHDPQQRPGSSSSFQIKVLCMNSNCTPRPPDLAPAHLNDSSEWPRPPFCHNSQSGEAFSQQTQCID